MKTVNTSELTGAALDWAVAKCEGVTEGKDSAWYYDRRDAYNYSTDWAQGGPIIERDGLCLTPRDYGWDAYVHVNLFKEDGSDFFQMGTTPLIAAMRCYVASKLGDSVEVPEGLL